ncbi:MAG TPA: metalloregulator ArsR/SmtB family transcription factor [Candidatus Corynebacterium avicola]|uniref:Metalloregulator ArsR/SmtB family transcription factor n=1 Tax=Candidatus Corynebacterium avicola TaxID=2838527 RepID=A0A9D1RNL6_9CORY|nr:metalloregulator ArsR/SmtB family transcription factor [Candidatus Corynebacterium avicola]
MPSTDEVFAAVANGHRRRLLDLLLREPQSVSSLAAHFDMARPSVSEHLRVLRNAGLVTEEKRGRERIYSLDAQKLEPLSEWLSPYEKFWRNTLKDLHNYLKEES